MAYSYISHACTDIQLGEYGREYLRSLLLGTCWRIYFWDYSFAFFSGGGKQNPKQGCAESYAVILVFC